MKTLVFFAFILLGQGVQANDGVKEYAFKAKNKKWIKGLLDDDDKKKSKKKKVAIQFRTKEEAKAYQENLQKVVTLNWERSEGDKGTYVIERFLKGEESKREIIGTIKASSYPQAMKKLSFMDSDAPYGIHEYRIIEKKAKDMINPIKPQQQEYFVDKSELSGNDK